MIITIVEKNRKQNDWLVQLSDYTVRLQLCRLVRAKKQRFIAPNTFEKVFIDMINNGNRTEWSPIRCVIIRAITKSDDRAVYHEYDYKLNWTTGILITN